jgi:hypothetical protein
LPWLGELSSCQSALSCIITLYPSDFNPPIFIISTVVCCFYISYSSSLYFSLCNPFMQPGPRIQQQWWCRLLTKCKEYYVKCNSIVWCW